MKIIEVKQPLPISKAQELALEWKAWFDSFNLNSHFQAQKLG